MRSIAQRHPMAVFLAIAYVASAAIFAIPLLASTGLGIIDLELPGVAPFILLSAISLAGAAFITTALAEGRDGVRDLRRRVFHFRVNPGWYAVAPGAPARGSARHGRRHRGHRPARQARHESRRRHRRRPRRRRRIRARQLVGGSGLDRLRPGTTPASARPDRGQRGHDLAAGPAPSTARVHRRWRDRRSRGPGAGPVLPRGAVHPSDPGPDRAHVALQLDRPKRADRRAWPTRASESRPARPSSRCWRRRSIRSGSSPASRSWRPWSWSRRVVDWGWPGPSRPPAPAARP